jgi:hypothetical protein
VLAEVANISQALIAALVEADALARTATPGDELAQLVRHARELGELLREAIGGTREVDARTRAMAETLVAAVESLEKQLQDHSIH